MESLDWTPKDLDESWWRKDQVATRRSATATAKDFGSYRTLSYWLVCRASWLWCLPTREAFVPLMDARHNVAGFVVICHARSTCLLSGGGVNQGFRSGNLCRKSPPFVGADSEHLQGLISKSLAVQLIALWAWDKEAGLLA